MKAVQILMDDELLADLDRTAKRIGRDRSKLVREAVAKFLAVERTREQEQAVIDAYRKKPLTRDELEWLGSSEWPTD